MNLSYEGYLNLKYFRGLDGIRALSAFMVIAHHMEDKFLHWLQGHSGVSIFFVLSGYLITTLLIREEKIKNRVSLKAFYIRRSFRIFPIYYVVLGVYCALIFGLDIEVFSSKREELAEILPYYLFYMNEFIPAIGEGTGAGFGHSWSLGIEEKFYLLWPIIGFVFLSSFRRYRLTFILIFMLSLLALNKYMPEYHFLNYYMLLVGCLFATLLSKQNTYNIIKQCTNGWLFYVAIGVFVFTHFMKAQFHFLILLYPFTIALFIAIVVIGNSKLTIFLENRLLKFCGRISYGIYLVHVLSLNAVQFVLKPDSDQLLIGVSTFILSAVLATCIAYGMNIIIEKPMISYGRRIASKYP